MGREVVSACSSKCAESGRSRQQVGVSGRTDVFWDGAGSSRSSFAGAGGAAELTVSAPGIFGAEGGQQGALARLDILVTQLNASTGNGRAV